MSAQPAWLPFNRRLGLHCILSLFFPTDRLVMLGNHRDAWIFGAVDPSSGTAALMETARVLGQLKDKGQCCGRLIGWLPWATHAPSIWKRPSYVRFFLCGKSSSFRSVPENYSWVKLYSKSMTTINMALVFTFVCVFGYQGWKPRRTVVLCSWGAEEPGLIGSTEWAEVGCLPRRGKCDVGIQCLSPILFCMSRLHNDSTDNHLIGYVNWCDKRSCRTLPTCSRVVQLLTWTLTLLWKVRAVLSIITIAIAIAITRHRCRKLTPPM